MRDQPNQMQTRSVQLDFFRGVALTIIFVNHMRLNSWSSFTPSHYGFSDAAETFVFLSGYAAALAYARCFQQAGVWLGTVRVLHRCLQIYRAHLTLFFVLTAIALWVDTWTDRNEYIRGLTLDYFFDNTREALLGLVTLSYVPYSFDILPMYLVMILWIPFVWVLSRIHVNLAIGFSALVYLAMWRFGLELPADPRSDRPWYFNPFAWQLIFFTGFALGAGWLRPPKPTPWLIGLCLLVVLLAIPLCHEPIYRPVAFLQTVHTRLEPWTNKSHFAPLRGLHFLALAFLVNHFFKARTHWLAAALPRWIAKMGQHSLPIFLLCTCLSYIGGMVLDWTGPGPASLALVNLGGWALMLATAQGLAWVQAKPWKAAAPGRANPSGCGRETDPSPAFSMARQWLRNIALAVILLPITAAPLMLTRKDQGNVGSGSAITSNRWPDGADSTPEDGVSRNPFVNRI